MDMLKRAYFLNRECSWLSFNQRVLKESTREENPLLERLRFIAITCSNLDEFFMIRVAGIKHLVESGIEHRDIAGLSPEEQMHAISRQAHRQYRAVYRCLALVLKELRAHGIRFVQPEELAGERALWLADLFEREIYPVVTPMALDPAHPFPFLASRSLNLAVKLRHTGEDAEKLAIVPVPAPVLDRLWKLPGETTFLFLEDILRFFAARFFTGWEIVQAGAFRLTRDADLDIRDDVEDLLAEVEKSLEKRRKGAAVRLEVAADFPANLSDFLKEQLAIEDMDIYRAKGPLGAAFFTAFANLAGFDRLRYPRFLPHPAEETLAHGDLWAALAEGDILVHHPFDSFAIVEKFIARAAVDERVLAIKQTLYRVAGDSPIIAALEAAAKNGKQVTVLMEVKARFDEENNILMARRLEEAGCHVIYGILGLKTHSKITMVIRREDAGLRRYCHIATGNYNGSTAKIYTDIGLFTADTLTGVDASAFFNFLSGFSDPPVWNRLAVAPLTLRERITEGIEQEIAHAKSGKRGRIVAKMNSLLDRFIIAKLYEASAAGVEIDLIVRGICVLRPGLKDVSENIRVRSIVGRFLEHSRIFTFYNDGKEDVFISSADWMPRNLNNRIELMAPVRQKAHKKRLLALLATYLADNTRAYLMRSDGSYRRVHTLKGERPRAAQEELMQAVVSTISRD